MVMNGLKRDKELTIRVNFQTFENTPTLALFWQKDEPHPFAASLSTAACQYATLTSEYWCEEYVFVWKTL